jgi:hypothetical protein
MPQISAVSPQEGNHDVRRTEIDFRCFLWSKEAGWGGVLRAEHSR